MTFDAKPVLPLSIKQRSQLIKPKAVLPNRLIEQNTITQAHETNRFVGLENVIKFAIRLQDVD